MMRRSLLTAPRLASRNTLSRNVRALSSSPSSSAGSSSAKDGQKDSHADPKIRIMEAAMNHVNRRGWSAEALSAGALDVGYPPVTHGLFRRGPAELAEFWMDRGNSRLSDFLDSDEARTLSGEQLAAEAISRRLEHTVPYLRSWPQAMALGLHPENLPSTLQKLHEIPSLICAAADRNDGSREWAKRSGAVGSVYAAAELYMLTDYSEGYADTRRFVQSRLRDSLNLQERAGPSAETLSALVGGVGSLLASAASLVAPAVPSARSRGPPKPPSPEEVFTQLKKGVEMASAKVKASTAGASSGVASASSSSKSTAAGAGVKTGPAAGDAAMSASNWDDGNDLAELGTVDGPSPLAPVQLPEKMSLFGLLSMPGKEAAELVQMSNPDFKVLVTNVNDESAEPRQEERLVRLLVNDQDIVVDVLRS